MLPLWRWRLTQLPNLYTNTFDITAEFACAVSLIDTNPVLLGLVHWYGWMRFCFPNISSDFRIRNLWEFDRRWFVFGKELSELDRWKEPWNLDDGYGLYEHGIRQAESTRTRKTQLRHGKEMFETVDSQYENIWNVFWAPSRLHWSRKPV